MLRRKLARREACGRRKSNRNITIANPSVAPFCLSSADYAIKIACFLNTQSLLILHEADSQTRQIKIVQNSLPFFVLKMQTTGKAQAVSEEARTWRVVVAAASETLRDVFGTGSTLSDNLCFL